LPPFTIEYVAFSSIVAIKLANETTFKMTSKRKQEQLIGAYSDFDLLQLKRWYYVRNYHLRYDKSPKRILQRTKAAAKRRNIEYSLPQSYALNLLNSPCFYCNKLRDKRGIDRVFNNTGYIPGNCAPACKWCNNAKATMCLHEFKEWIKDISQFI